MVDPKAVIARFFMILVLYLISMLIIGVVLLWKWGVVNDGRPQSHYRHADETAVIHVI